MFHAGTAALRAWVHCPPQKAEAKPPFHLGFHSSVDFAPMPLALTKGANTKEKSMSLWVSLPKR